MSKIEWTDRTWNPIAGCSDVSEGCRNCYARTMAKRLEAMGTSKYAGLTVHQGSKTVWTGTIAFDEDALLAPLKRKKPTRYFVNSMSDLFHGNVTGEMIDRIFAVMALCPQHTFQVLTKRPERMLEYLSNSRLTSRVVLTMQTMFGPGYPARFYDDIRNFADNEGFPLPNVWLGVSVENQAEADKRIPLLLQTPSASRFISAEPLLGAVDLTDINAMVWFSKYMALINPHEAMRQANNDFYPKHCSMDTLTGSCVAVEPELQERLDWVIVGGESGHKARPMHPDWARSLRDQCVAAGVPFFFKQWGEWLPQTGGDDQLRALPATTPVTMLAVDGHRGQSMFDMEGHPRFGRMLRVGKKAAGRLLDGREWNEVPA